MASRQDRQPDRAIPCCYPPIPAWSRRRSGSAMTCSALRQASHCRRPRIRAGMATGSTSTAITCWSATTTPVSWWVATGCWHRRVPSPPEDSGGLPRGHHLVRSAGRRCRPSSGPSRSRVLASRLWGFLSGDVPGRNRCRPPGAATPVDISPRRRHRLDRSGLCRRRHLGAVGLPAADRAPHAGLGARRVFAAARYRSSESRAPLPVSGACGSLGAVGATPRPPARAGDLSGLAPARLPSRCCGRGLRARSASPPGPVF